MNIIENKTTTEHTSDITILSDDASYKETIKPVTEIIVKHPTKGKIFDFYA